MSVPLDNLYHWVEGLLPAPACVYVFRPHGSKKISDLVWLKEYNLKTKFQLPGVIMHDQEPLDWNFYNCPDQWQQLWKEKYSTPRWKEKFEFHDDFIKEDKNNNDIDWIVFPPEFYDLKFTHLSKFNLKSEVLRKNAIIYDQTILVHSEKNSVDLKHYRDNDFLCVHYWAHAVIARDWFRFAEHDARLTTCDRPQNTFLIYCRDWSHRREYRLKFLELLIENNLHHHSQTSVMHVNSDDVHFLDYKFLNTRFKIDNPTLIDQIPNNEFSSASSADYDHNDFISTQISVILETVFDDDRIHLTEKTLKPIACGHPFILAAGTGALDYVRSYGFKTFAPWIDESYDQESDSLRRMEKIMWSMTQIQNLQGQEREDFFQQIKSIAEFNKRHFFSDAFFDQVKNELKDNLNLAMQQVAKSQGKHYLEWLKILKKNKILDSLKVSRASMSFKLRQLRQSCPRDQSNPQSDPLA
jgi:hypothetical protein